MTATSRNFVLYDPVFFFLRDTLPFFGLFYDSDDVPFCIDDPEFVFIRKTKYSEVIGQTETRGVRTERIQGTDDLASDKRIKMAIFEFCESLDFIALRIEEFDAVKGFIIFDLRSPSDESVVSCRNYRINALMEANLPDKFAIRFKPA